MRNWICILLLLGLTTVLTAQITRREVVNNSPTPADDNKPNSDKVPDVYAIDGGKFERVVVLRFKYKTDLLGGLEKMVKDQKIRNAVILSAVGSVTGYQVHSVSNETFPSKNVFVKNPHGPADLVGMNGYVIDGKVHAHLTLTNENGAFGGHLEPETTVFTFAIVTLGVFGDGVDLSRVDDKSYR